MNCATEMNRFNFVIINSKHRIIYFFNIMCSTEHYRLLFAMHNETFFSLRSFFRAKLCVLRCTVRTTLQQRAPAAAPQSLGVGLNLPPCRLQMALLLCPGAVDAGSPGVECVHQV